MKSSEQGLFFLSQSKYKYKKSCAMIKTEQKVKFLSEFSTKMHQTSDHGSYLWASQNEYNKSYVTIKI